MLLGGVGELAKVRKVPGMVLPSVLFLSFILVCLLARGGDKPDEGVTGTIRKNERGRGGVVYRSAVVSPR